MNSNAHERSPARGFAGCAVLVLALATAGRAEADDDPLVGLWVYQWASTPGLRGELAVTRKGTSWRAVLSGSESRFEVTGNDVRFGFPDDRGSFRGTLTGKAVDGFWLQPAGGTRDPRDPGGTGQRFATPLSLAPAGRDVWRGTVRPLDARFTLYVKIYRNSICRSRTRREPPTHTARRISISSAVP